MKWIILSMRSLTGFAYEVKVPAYKKIFWC